MATKRKKFNLSSFVMNSPVALWMILFVAIPFIYVVCISFMHKKELMEELHLNLLQIIIKPYLIHFI